MTATLAPPATDGGPPAPPSSRRRSPRELGALAVLLAGTAVLYLWDLGASGWANSYYAAAVRAMTGNWTAFFFASLDAGNVVTVDKPPASLWAMALSARVFGFSSWSMLVPQALMGVAAVALLYAAVRRASGPSAGLLAGLALALTPVAVLMFRFNNPDALLVLLMVAAAYAVVRAIEHAGTGWLLLAGVFIGFAFLTKMGQAFLVLPAFVLAYLVSAPTGLWRRIRQLLGAAAAVVVSAGWYVAVVELWPADSRPYIGGSEDNSLLELALGYNGLGRIFGQGGGGGGGSLPELPPLTTGEPELVRIGGGPGGGFGGPAGLTRMFSDTAGGQISWLLPAALALLVIGLWLTRRAPRTDRTRTSLLLWGGWTVVTLLVFSFAEGIFHEYYTVALAPGIVALVAVGGRELWRHRTSPAGRLTLAAVVAGTAVWAWVLLARTPDFLPWLRWALAGVAVLALPAVVVPGAGRRRFAVVAALATVLTGVGAPAAYAVQTAGTAHTGSIPSAGPAVADPGPGGSFTGGPGGGATTVGPDLVVALQAAGTTWAAATVGSGSGADLALASGTTVMSIGGFSGSDPAPTLEQFQAYVAAGQIRYFIPGGGPGFRTTTPGDEPTGGASTGGARTGGGPAGGDATGGDTPGGGQGPGGRENAITTWVEQNFAAQDIGGRTVYDLSQRNG